MQERYKKNVMSLKVEQFQDSQPVRADDLDTANKNISLTITAKESFHYVKSIPPIKTKPNLKN